ncbi:hypothetical protein FOZ61_008678 [Perkinsus olseni]|uniref:Major facilitator superfamily (MFS) profile domain-containing protein n=1 Tax=Perkinsus olseni TaxID=32597 RepID=A0A7J6L4I7_PEROL|nr:hypothetical protein FOL46_009039 [Perkinsus olseni]KAF4653786.1 hypothetical protein FOZ61_008678 [Perkinsus olseni]
MIFFSIFLEWLGSTLLAPVTPWYIEDLAPDMNQGTAASILMAAYAVGTFLASLVTGPLSDRLGRRPVFLTAMTIYTVAQFLMANAWDIGSFAGFRAMAGVAAGTRPCIMAYLTDSSRPIDMKMYGVFMGLFVVVGQSLGPAIGGALASVTLSFPFYFIGVISAALLVFMYLFLRESLVKDEHGMPINKFASPEEKDPPTNKFLWPTVACLATASFSGQYLQINWSTVCGLVGADQYHLSTSANGGLLGIQAIASIVVNCIYLPLTHVLESALLGSIGMLIAIGIVGVPFIDSVVGVIFLGMCIQAGTALYFAGMAYFNSVIAPPKKRGLINSCVMGAANVGGIVGPLVGGDLYDLDPTYPFYLSVILSCVGSLACLGIHFGIKHQLKLFKKAAASAPTMKPAVTDERPPSNQGDTEPKNPSMTDIDDSDSTETAI